MLEELKDPYPTSKSKIYCNNCRTVTNHLRKFGPIFREIEDEKGFIYFVYHVWSCAGCDAIFLEIMNTPSFYLNEEGEREYESFLFPKRMEFGCERKIFQHLPKELDRIYAETICAFNDGLHLLCSIGLRSLLEGICSDRQALGDNLFDKIDALKVYLPENLVNSLHEFRFIGNEAVHDLITPEKFVLKLAIEVIEDLMNYLYELDDKAGRISLWRNIKPLDDENDKYGGESPYGTIN